MICTPCASGPVSVHAAGPPAGATPPGLSAWVALAEELRRHRAELAAGRVLASSGPPVAGNPVLGTPCQAGPPRPPRPTRSRMAQEGLARRAVPMAGAQATVPPKVPGMQTWLMQRVTRARLRLALAALRQEVMLSLRLQPRVLAVAAPRGIERGASRRGCGGQRRSAR